MLWKNLISPLRLGLEQYQAGEEETRSTFQRDFDRMVFSSPFRRLQNKTQVFPLPGHIFVHNRLTHSLEVSSVGRSMASEISEALAGKYASEPGKERLRHIPDIVAAACLCHDLGNPPFGHSGEKAIGAFFSRRPDLRADLSDQEWNDLTHFEGNANSLRLLTHRFAGRRDGGQAMTYSTLAAIVKYPASSLNPTPQGKFGFFSSELDTYRRIAEHLDIPAINQARTRFARHPLVFIVEAADDICYQIMDIEDAHKLRILSHSDTVEHLLAYLPEPRRQRAEKVLEEISDPGERIAFLRSKAIGELTRECAAAFLKNEEAILEGSHTLPLIKCMPSLTAREAYQACTHTAYSRIYSASEVVDIELAGHSIITSLLESLLEAVLHPELYSSRLLLHKIPQQYETSSPTRYGRIMSVLDHVSAMTDVYALDLYRKLQGHNLPAV